MSEKSNDYFSATSLIISKHKIMNVITPDMMSHYVQTKWQVML